MAFPLNYGRASCANCGKEFMRRNKSAKYCTKSCCDMATRKRNSVKVNEALRLAQSGKAARGLSSVAMRSYQSYWTKLVSRGDYRDFNQGEAI